VEELTLWLFSVSYVLLSGNTKGRNKKNPAKNLTTRQKNVQVYRFIEESGKKSGTYQSGYLFGVEMIRGVRGKTISVKA